MFCTKKGDDGNGERLDGETRRGERPTPEPPHQGHAQEPACNQCLNLARSLTQGRLVTVTIPGISAAASTMKPVTASFVNFVAMNAIEK